MHEIRTIWDVELGYSFTSLMGSIGLEVPETVVNEGDGAEPMWGISQVLPDESTVLHVLPHSTFEWRCAEYGIDPDDLDTLLDVVLHEPWIPHSGDALAWADPATAAVLADTASLPTCWTPGVPDADRLAAHLTRISAVKQHIVELQPATRADRQAALVYVGSDRTADADPLDPIRTRTRLDPVRVAGRRLAVQRVRDPYAPPTFEVKPPATFIGNQFRTGGMR